MPINDSPLAEFLVDPWAAIDRLAHVIGDWLTVWGPSASVLLAVMAVATVAARRWWFRCQRALHADARVVTIMTPPTVDPAGAQAVWSNLVGLLRPAWRRAIVGQPHVAFEYAFDRDGVQLRLWVPGPVPPGLVERAVEAARPGARTQTGPADPPLPLDMGERSRVRSAHRGFHRLVRDPARSRR